MVSALGRNSWRLCLWVVLVTGACKPELEGRPSFVEGERILAVRSLPAEAKASTAVSYEALFVGPDGVRSGDELSWAMCNERKSLTQSGTISNNCLVLEAPVLESLGEGNMVSAMLPRTVCETFGPLPRTPKPGEPNFRPVDPDTTGGYYQPVRVVTLGDTQRFADGMTRLSCGLGGATQSQTADFNRRYRSNENPRLDSLSVVRDDGSEEQLPEAGSGGDNIIVLRNERLRFRAAWSACPSEPSCGDGICSSGEVDCPDDCREPHGCTGSELYVHFDTINRTLTERREAVRVSWFATTGEFEFERTGQTDSDDPENDTENGWVAPADAGDTLLWVVIRDDRGGVAWSSYRLQVF